MSMYQTFAEVYDRFMNEQTEAFAPYVIRLLSDFAAEAPARVLDIGCGTGKTAIALAKTAIGLLAGIFRMLCWKKRCKMRGQRMFLYAFSRWI